jgi:intein/homing endonuclease
VNDRYSTGFQGLEVGHDKYKQHVPEQQQKAPPPNYSKSIPIGTQYKFPGVNDRDEPVTREEAGVAEMQLSSSDRILICDRTGSGKCLSKDSRIYTNQGYRQAQKLFKDHARQLSEVDNSGEWYSVDDGLKLATLTSDGSIEWTRPSRIYRQEFSQKLKKVELADGSQIHVTETHPLLTENGWTSDIEEGDEVAVPKYLPDTDEEKISPKLAKLVSWQIAEGNESGKYSCRIEQKEREVLEELKSIFDTFGFKKETGLKGNPGKSYATSVNVDPDIRKTNKGLYKIQLSSKQYRKCLENKIGYEWGLNSAEKKIPEGIMKADKQAKRVFIREYLDADGSVVKAKNGIEFISASEKLIRQLKSLLKEFGVWMRISPKKVNGFDHTYWRGYVRSEELRKYRDRIGFKRKSKALPDDEEYNSNTNGIPCCDIISELKEENIPVGEVRSYDSGKKPSREKIRNLIIQLHRVKHYYRSQSLNLGWNFSPDIKKGVYEDLDEDWLDSKIERLQEFVDQDVWWSKVVSIEEVEYEGYIYDFCVPETRNFIAEDMVVHNTALLKRIVYGLHQAGQKIIHLTDVKNDFADIDTEGGVPQPFIQEAGLHPGESPESIPVQVFQPRLLYNEYRRSPPDVLEGMETFAYGFQDLRESEIKTLVNATSDTQSDILTNAIAANDELTYSSLEDTVLSIDANPQAKRSLMNSIRRLKEQEVLHDSYRDKLPVDSLEDGVVAVSMDNWDSFKREGREKLEIQIAIALRIIQQRLRDSHLEGPVTPVFDEAHVFCSAKNDISTPEVVDMIDLGRDYDIPMLFSSQRPSQLSQSIIDGLSHFFIGKNVPPSQRMDLLKAADLVNHEDYSTGKWTKIFREMGKYEFLQVDSERSLWRVVSPFAPPCFHPWQD